MRNFSLFIDNVILCTSDRGAQEVVSGGFISYIIPLYVNLFSVKTDPNAGCVEII